MRLLIAAIALALSLPLHAADKVENLARLVEVWSTVKYLDPQLMTGEIDWDGAFVRAVPKVRAAKTHEEFVQAVGSMLAELNDPVTGVRKTQPDPAKPKLADTPLHRMEGDVLILNLGPYAAAGGSLWTSGSAIAAEVAKADRVIVDLRGDDGSAGTAGYFVGMIGLVNETTPMPPSRAVFHSGYAPQEGSSSGGYYSALQLIAEPSLQKPSWLSGKVPSRIVLLTRGNRLSAAAAALWWSGAAAIVSEAPLGDHALATARPIDLGEQWTARVRITEPAVSGLAADAVVGGDGMAKALELARGSGAWAPRPPMQPVAAMPRHLREKPYTEMTAPDLPHRLLALARLWSVIDRFYPYKHLITDWDAALRTMIPLFESAGDEKAYAAAVLEAVALIEDGHSFASGHPAMPDILGGTHLPGVQLRIVEGQYVVTHTLSDRLKIGDVVTAVDGKPLGTRIAELRRYVTASTERSRTQRILNSALRGAKESEAVLTIRNDDGSTREVRLPRDQATVPQPQKTTPVYRILDGNIGYADLTRLNVGDVDAMFEAFRETKAILFDMRGYPRGTAWAIAPRINTNKATRGASFRRMEVSGMSFDTEISGFFFDQPLPELEEGKSLYTKPTAMLIDDRAISQSEHSGLFYEAANGTTFIGEPTAGANGDVTSFPLPGGFRVGFTGHDVRHSDGRQLQRVGLQPHIKAEPTIRGIREGKDEVLERAVAWANEVADKTK